MPGRPAPIEERFWAKVHKSDGCWEWQGYVGPHGYGQFDFRFASRAHRASWILTHGEIPCGLNVLHRCDNKRCVRPDHLFLGTQKDNVIDCSNKGRISRGEDRPQSKLTEQQVQSIRALYVKGKRGFGLRKLAERFGVEPCYIAKIVNRTAWRHVA